MNFIHRIVRRIVAGIVRFTIKVACKTYGDTAELSPGPCQRCVGHEVRGVKTGKSK